MWTAIWTVLGFVLPLALLLFLGDSILAFTAEQLRQRRAYRSGSNANAPIKPASPTTATR